MKTQLIRSARTEEKIREKIEKHFGADIELIPVNHREWKVKHSGIILNDHRVIRKSSKGASRIRLEKIIEY
jgi:uncharacterized protein Veg